MFQLGYHVSHEQFLPSELLRYVIKAEKAGFGFALSSDHFYPWNEAQGQSGYAWSWLGAALAVTTIPMGVVTCPYHRYHPAIIAQATATLLEMFPERFWVAAGSGQMLNEGISGKSWPTKAQRHTALKEAVEVMRQLWAGEEVSYSGHFEVREAKLYTRPPHPPMVLGAAITKETAAFLAPWADGLITINQPLEKLEEIKKVWLASGGKGKPMYLKFQVSFDENRDMALQMAYEQWKTNIFESDMLSQLRTPKQFEQAAVHVKPDDLEEHVLISNEPGEYVEKIATYKDLGFTAVSVHNVNKKQELFIDFFSQHVLPQFK